MSIVRLIIFIIVTLIVAAFFFFEPELNIGMHPVISMYDQIRLGQPVFPIITRLFIFSLAIFFGLVFLIGLEATRSNEESQEFKNKR